MNKFLFSLCTFSLASCGGLPVLEGGQVKIDHGGEVKSALEELSKIDIIYELDPRNYGFCHRDEERGFDDLSGPAKLRCAFDGFYSYQYFNDLDPNQRKSLNVSNVAFAYAEKQTSRISELAKRFDAAISPSGQDYYRKTTAAIQTKVIDAQVTDLEKRVQNAQQYSEFLEFQRRKRNHVQSMFLSASDAACDLYKRNLNSIYSSSNFTFGSVATISGGLGAILTHADDARALAGMAGVTSGLRAEYNDAFFRNKVVELLTKAMDIARDRKREEIKRRSAQITADYSMEDALDDAILYNSNCSLVAGLQETSESLQTVSDPGLKWLANAFGGAASNQELTGSLFQSLGQAVSTIQQIQKATEDQNAVVIPDSSQPDSQP